jgi:cobalt-zinc-cadmium efflux system outer membrane protein
MVFASLLAAAIAAAPALAPTDAPAAAPSCQGRLARGDLIACALAASPEVVAGQRGVEAVQARRLSARTLLPSNPRIEVTAAHRSSAVSADRNANFYGTLSQEVEVAGQRRRRLAVVDAEVEGAAAEVAAIEREIAAEALRRYYEALAARDERAMIERIARGLERLAELAEAGEEAGLGSGLGTEVATATVVKIRRRAIEAERRQATALSLLAALLGQDPAAAALELSGELVPLTFADDLSALIERGLDTRAELAIAAAEREARKRQAAFYRRLRAPNPSFVVYGQRDGFFENVIGGGVGLSVPLPSPLGHTFKGEIAEAEARARQVDAEVEGLRRRIRAEIVAAHQESAAREAELALFDDARLTRVEGYLAELTEEMTAGRMAIREGALLQLALLDLLAAYIEARRARCLASVELARAAGLLPEGVR